MIKKKRTRSFQDVTSLYFNKETKRRNKHEQNSQTIFLQAEKGLSPLRKKKNRHEKERAYPHDTGGTHGAQPDCLEHRLTRAVR